MKKLSIYNITIENNKKYIYFNTYTGASVGLNEKEHKVLETEFKNLEHFEKTYPNIFQKFYNTGFIIDEQRNEKEEIIFNKKRAVFLDREYRLFLHPTLDCNFNCWYCYEEHPKGMMSEETKIKIKKHIENMGNIISGIHLSWFGGEPLMYYYEIVEPLSVYTKNLMNKKNLSFKNSITTNGYYINKEMIQSFKNIALNTFQITLDGEKNKHDKVRKHYNQPTFDIITSNIIDICNEITDATIVLRINYDEKTLEAEPTFLNLFPAEIRKKIMVDFHRVWQVCRKEADNHYFLNTKLMKWMEFVADQGFVMSFSKLHPQRQLACYVDKYYHAEIDHLGNVFKCTARGYSEKYIAGYLLDTGEIKFKKDFEAKIFNKLTVENEKCINCLFLPMCGKLCTQNTLELKPNELSCVLQSAEIPIKEAIIKNYEYFNKITKMNKKNNYQL